MKPHPLIVHSLVLLGVALLAASTAWAEPMSPARQSELVRLVRQDCGSCHGMTLRGGLGPALLPETLQDKPADSLVQTILQGRPGTAMPGWSSFMNEDEAGWIVARLAAGFPALTQGNAQ